MKILRMTCLLLALLAVPAFSQTKPTEANASSAPAKAIQSRDYFSLRNQAMELKPAEVPQLLTRAQAGDMHAQIVLGMAYQLGSGVPRDAAEALKWYHTASDQGSSIAANQIAVYYDPFEGFAGRKGQDANEALKWYRTAADRNDAVGQYDEGALLAELHREPEAKDWYVGAIEKGYWEATTDLVALYDSGKIIPDKSKDENRKEGVALFQRLANDGNGAAEYALARIYGEGWLGVHRDRQTAFSWYQKAAAQGIPKAEYMVGFYHFEGHGGLPKNEAEGAKWFLNAANDQDADAQLAVAFLYEKGIQVPKDEITALMWYMLAFEGGAQGTQIPRNARETFDWIRLRHHFSDAETQEAQKRLHQWKVEHGLEK